jgi:hypothetical protein
MHAAVQEIAAGAQSALAKTEAALPAGFPEKIHLSVKAALLDRLKSMTLPAP